jgi:hypothetical protein
MDRAASFGALDPQAASTIEMYGHYRRGTTSRTA